MVIIKRLLGQVTGHNDHYIINMGGQRLEIGGNRPLNGPYFQRCLAYLNLKNCDAQCDLFVRKIKMQNEFVCTKKFRALPIFLLSKIFCTVQTSAFSKDLIQIPIYD